MCLPCNGWVGLTHLASQIPPFWFSKTTPDCIQICLKGKAHFQNFLTNALIYIFIAKMRCICVPTHTCYIPLSIQLTYSCSYSCSCYHFLPFKCALPQKRVAIILKREPAISLASSSFGAEWNWQFYSTTAKQ